MVVNATSRQLYPQESPSTIVNEAGYPQGRSGQVRKISPLIGILWAG